MPKNTDAHELHRAVLEAQLDGLLYLDSGGFIRYANAAAGLLLDSSAADLVGTTFEYPLHNTERTELEITLKDQEKRILEARVSGSENGLEGHVLVQLRDISDLRQSNLIHHTFYDHLTDLPNRMLFKDRLKLELFHSQRSRKLVAVVVLNINRFKSINEALGYTLGDRILQLVASRLRETFRRSDTVARIGSDEFGLVLPGLNKAEDCSRLASKIITAFEEVCTVDRHELYLSVCLGIALHPDDGTTVDTLLKNAGTALDRARQQGRNTFQLYSEANQTLAYERVELERQLCKAMDNEEFEVYYQPQISLVDHRILGGEALLRWNSIGSGLVPAYHFITLAEETGLIQPIGDWVVRTVCRQIALWEKLTDRPFCITVNISPLQFSRDGFVDNLIALIKECGLDTSHLGLEITEHLLMKDVSVAVRDLRRLRQLLYILSRHCGRS